MMTLFSYCLTHDGGFAPNPYYRVCTLAICKPQIRREAKAGDWVVGSGRKGAPNGETSVIYAMKVTKVLSMKEYDEYCRRELPNKIPNVNHPSHDRQAGDCVYDYSRSVNPKKRDGVHDGSHRENDLGGKNVLLSTHFHYFGEQNAPKLPDSLHRIIHKRGFKSHGNALYAEAFVKWFESNMSKWKKMQPSSAVGKRCLPPKRKKVRRCGGC